jgi:hypothetical protein
MSARLELNSYIGQLERRLRLKSILRGAAILTSAALITTLVLVWIANGFAFSRWSVNGSRLVLLIALSGAIVFGLVLPVMRLTRRHAANKAEQAFPQFKQRLVTFAERDPKSQEPFLELLAADTLEIARGSEPKALVPDAMLLTFLGAGVASLGVLVWIIAAGPGYMGYGASLLWKGHHEGAAPFYDIHVHPGDASVRRHADELITAQPIGLQTEKVRLYARYQSASKWEQVNMQPQPGGSAFQFLFAGLPEDVEYYVEAGAMQSRHFNIHVVDLPAVKQIRVTYHFPQWTGLKTAVEEHGGDLQAIEGTRANLDVLTDRPLRNGMLVLSNGQQIPLTSTDGAHNAAAITMDKDGSYHIAAIDHGQPVRLSEDFFIAANKANPPEIQIVRPGPEYRASPIEEVTIGVKAQDQFGINNLTLHYSVNGGPEQTTNLLKQKGQKEVDGSTVLSLENFKLSPGDVVSLYASAKDARTEAHTDISFIQAEPFEREFSQSQQSGGGGGGGGGSGGLGAQADIARREKEIISATWKQQVDKSAASQHAAENAKFLSEVQSKLRDQALALAGRLQMRDLNEQNQEFDDFQKDMNAAAEAMNPAADKLNHQKWSEALPNEQKALQHLLQAEATFRKIEVAFGNAGGGGGAGGSAGRDLASLFDLELDTQKNQYETAQTASSAGQHNKDIDDALKKLDDLARRQQELAQQQQAKNGQSFEEKWQQEILRRQAEELQRQMEQLSRGQQQQASSGSQGQASGQQGQEPGNEGQQSQGNSGQSASGQSSSGGSSSGASQRALGQSGASGQSQQADRERVQQALNQLRQAANDMRRAASAQQSAADARQAADRLKEATSLLSGVQRQQTSGQLDSMSREADKIAAAQRAQAERMRQLQQGSFDGSDQGQQNAWNRAQSLAQDRQHLADDLGRLENEMRDAERRLAATQRGAASKLRDTLGEMDRNDLQTQAQKSADRLRRGYVPNSDSTEQELSKGLEHLADGVRGAQQALGPDQGQDSQTALDRVERLRNQMEALTRDLGARTGQGRQQGQLGQAGQAGQQTGTQGGQQRSAQNGLARNGGSASNQASNQGGGGPIGGPGAAMANGNRYDGFTIGGQRGDGVQPGPWIDTGNNSNLPQPAAPDMSPIPGDPERTFQQSVSNLNQLRQSVQNDPEAARALHDLIQEMQQLDPKRFPGNPALLDQLHSQVLHDVNNLEMQLRRKLDDKSGDIRSDNAMTVPPGYEDAVAEYFRRLSKPQ